MNVPLTALALAIFLPLSGGARRPKAPASPVDLNAATATELVQLPGVGPGIAARIVAHRKAHGPFRRPEDLLEVRGLGNRVFQRLRPHVTVGP
ncbi:ComEA family DNA-binding protein [Mesoterricola sediminis]|uniref:Helix-hairpin-helix DNA-binding motif class 1 domain-containing protein n=1 Tax=Mesoterricola sediminis TaxID=2927980 RepID=A0AA48GRE0_9BACT|nr:helix-hairpin-helix domain-containing protein [Mesoterricola sediminis]BDU76182.1 hypothetical protein METESE_11400 [Mesoterricola sediminis]